MGRILAIDYGKKRVDPCGIIATGLQTVLSQEIFRFLEAYLSHEKVDLFVVGHPKQMDNSDSESMTYIKPFLSGLKRRFPHIPIVMYDERFTSVLAHRTMLEAGLKKKDRQNKALVDEISATIILQTYLENKRFSFL